MNSIFCLGEIAGKLIGHPRVFEADDQVSVPMAYGQEEAYLHSSIRPWDRRNTEVDNQYRPSPRIRPLCLW
jgi:hypothetical protein